MKKSVFMKKMVFICYFATVFALLGFTVSLVVGMIPLMLLFAAAFAGCIVWFCKLIDREERWEYKQHRERSKALGKMEKDIEALRTELSGKADKQVDINTRRGPRPGSRQSIAYQNMVVERSEKHDSRTENQGAAQAERFESERII